MRPEKPQLFDIWENPKRDNLRWHVQMVNYVAHFDTEVEAEIFASNIKKFRETEARAIKSK